MHFLAKEMKIYLNLYPEVQDVKFTIISEYINKLEWFPSHAGQTLEEKLDLSILQ